MSSVFEVLGGFPLIFYYIHEMSDWRTDGKQAERFSCTEEIFGIHFRTFYVTFLEGNSPL